MTNSEVEQIAPESIILPSIPYEAQAATAGTGTIGISGATLVYFNGTGWKCVAGT
jgi:hypothetical protein